MGDMAENDIRPNIYMPALPLLDLDHLEAARKISDARFSLFAALQGRGFFAKDIFRTQPVWAANIDDVMQKIDGVLFPPMAALLAEGNAAAKVKAQRLFEFLSVITSMHVGDRAAYGGREVSKPCVAIDTDGFWSLVVEMLRGLKEKGAFSTNVDDILSIIRPEPGAEIAVDDLNARAVAELQLRFKDNAGKSRKEVPKEWPEGHVFESFRKDRGKPRSDFGVIAFGSATMHNAAIEAEGYRFGESVGKRGLRMISGAGKGSMMGAFAEGFFLGAEAFRQKTPDAPDPAHIGISTNEILCLEGPPVLEAYKRRSDLTPQEIKDYSLLDQLVVVPDRGTRLRAFFGGYGSGKFEERVGGIAGVAAVFPGGIGSLEEFATMMQMKLHGRMMDHTEIHLMNINGYYNELTDLCQKAGVGHLFNVYTGVEASISRIAELKTTHEHKTHSDETAMENIRKAALEKRERNSNPGYN